MSLHSSPLSRKQALLHAAKELFGQYGYADTTFKKISERAGVALGLLTHHYGNKEQLFLAAGLDVLDAFLRVLRRACQGASTGRDGVLAYCRAYLNFSIDPESHWLVLVRCSPFSDTASGHEEMTEKFSQVLIVLEEQLRRGVADGTLRPMDAHEVAQVILATMVGANRTRLLTPYASPRLYDETLDMVERAVVSAPSSRG